MSTLRDYLCQKRDALRARQAVPAAERPGPLPLQARVTAEGRSGIRRIRIRDFQVTSDSEPELAGYNLGPSSPELQLGVLGSCITHVYLIQAADRGVQLDALEVEVSGVIDPRAGTPGFEHIPTYPHDIQYTVHVDTCAADFELAALRAEVERVCPIFNLLTNPQTITGALVNRSEMGAELTSVAH